MAEPGTKFRLELLGLKIAPAIRKDFGPDILMMPIPPRPPGVAMAAIVSGSTVIFLINHPAASGWGIEKTSIKILIYLYRFP